MAVGWGEEGTEAVVVCTCCGCQLIVRTELGFEGGASALPLAYEILSENLSSTTHAAEPVIKVRSNKRIQGTIEQGYILSCDFRSISGVMCQRRRRNKDFAACKEVNRKTRLF